MKRENIAPAKKFGDVYRHIYFNKANSRQQLAGILNISLPTVSQNLALLSDMGLIFSSGEFESTGGRKANMLSIVPEARYAVGVDITSLRTVFVLADLKSTRSASASDMKIRLPIIRRSTTLSERFWRKTMSQRRLS